MKPLRSHLFVAAVLSLIMLSGLHARLRDALLDARFLMLPRTATATIALVEIDPKSIEAIGVWPWTRSLHAQLIGALEKAGVTDVVFDVDFSSRSTPAADDAFADALRAAGGSTVLAAFRQRVPDRGDGITIHVNRPIPQFADAAWLGIVNVVPERDGIIRRYSYGDRIGGEFYASVGALLAGTQDAGAEPFRIDFGINPESLPTVSFIDVIRGTPAAVSVLRGKKVIVSGTAAELGDRFNVPNGRIIPGSMVQALAAESILQGRALNDSPRPFAPACAGFLILIMVLSWRRTRPSTRVYCLTAGAVAVEALAVGLQAARPIVPDTSLILVACLAYLLATGFEELDLRGLLRSVAERRFQRIAMSLGDGLVCTDSAGLITLWNPGAAVIFGYEASEVVGHPFETLLPVSAEDRERFSPSAYGPGRIQEVGGTVLELVGRRKSGEHFDLECSLSSWDATDGLQYGAILRDISQRKRQQERIRYLAEFDTLTGLLNQNSLIARIDERITNAEAGRPACVLMLVGIDRFDQISNLQGHTVSDRLLNAMAGTLSSLSSAGDELARLNNNEFAILAFRPVEAVNILASAIVAHFRDGPVMLGRQGHRLMVSVGLACGPDAANSEELLGNARFALATAKGSTGARVVSYEREMREALERRHGLEAELRDAAARDEFELFYQPQVELATGRFIGAEALIRWRHPERGYVSPGEFMPIVNTTSLSDAVAAWVLDTACRQAAEWQHRGFPIRVGVNLSQSQFVAGYLVKDVEGLLQETGLTPALLELEVTEDIILDNVDGTQRTLDALRNLGVRIAFDDFGTGYGSLTYLKAFPLDKIKIDQSFVRNLVLGSDDEAIVRATIGLSKALGLSVIAEGIESAAVGTTLLEMGCFEGQGYHFGRPMPLTQFEELCFSELPTRMVA